MSTTKKMILFIVVAMFFAGILLVTGPIASAIPINKRTENQWPSFEMAYKVESLGENGEYYSQVVMLVYENDLHWKTWLLSHDLAPDMVGYRSEYAGKDLITYDPRTGSSSRNTDVPTDGIYVPDQWLRPNYIPNLISQKGIIVQPGQKDGFNDLALTEYSPCPDDPSVIPCKAGRTRVLETKIEYRNTDFIPLSIIDSIDGIVVRRILITELVFQE